MPQQPCELMLRRPLRTILGLIKPNTETKFTQQQGQQKYNNDTHSRGRLFDVGQQVMVHSYHDGGHIWVKGQIVKKQGDLTFMVEIEDAVVWK